MLRGILVGAGLATSCVVIDPKAQLCAVGGEGCACTQGGACDFGLACRDSMCIDPDAPGTTGMPGDTSNGETDDVADTGDDTGTEDTGLEYGPNYAFVTSTEHTAGSLGGLEGADAICQLRAEAAGLPGNYRAWLSASGTHAKDRFAGVSGWIRPDGSPFARSLEQVIDGKFFHPAMLDETGSVPSSWSVWTGTDPQGLGYDHGGNYCGGWAQDDAEQLALQGDLESGFPWWTDSHLRSCDGLGRLYCLGTDHDYALEVEPVDGRRVFVSSALLLSGGGIEAADDLCQANADQAGLGGTFLALMGTTTMGPAERFDLEGAPWVRVDGIPLFAPGEAFGPRSATPVAFHANGNVAPNWLTWFGSTGPMVPGTAAETCEDWTSQTGTSGTLNMGNGFHTNWYGWTIGDVEECTDEWLVLCFEE
jgi:hypothetical protein